jgi:addiction module RelE/StbE family toxin
MRISWSQAARSDLKRLRRYIAQDSPYYAKQFTQRLTASADKLADFPKIGKAVSEAEDLDKDIREIIFGDYRIIYLAEAKRVNILAVIHGARDLAGAQDKPWR